MIDNCIKSAYNNSRMIYPLCCFIVFRKSQGTLAPLTFSFVFIKIIMEGGARTHPEGGSGTGPVRSLLLIYQKGGQAMSFQDIATLIGSYAFPIVMCILMWSGITKKDEQHKEEMDTMKTAIDANTAVLKELIIKLEAVL